MPRDSVQVLGHLARPPEDAWQILRDFCAPWHPWIATMTEERGPAGARIRAFTVAGDPALYREQQTYLSDSDRVLGYTHVQGIRDCESYDARITVSAAEGGGCHVHWTAQLRAPAARLQPICDGTRAVFEAGIAALATAALPGDVADPAPEPVEPKFETLILDDLPRLALTVATPTEGSGRDDDRLCLFLHGIGGGRSNWQDQLAAAGRRMRAAALDLRGYGDSSLGARQSSVDDYCADILRVAERLGARRLVLVGLSYGSWIATSFAMRHPQMLAGLVLSGGCTGMSEAGPEEREAFRVSREVPLNAGQVPADFAPAVVRVLAGPSASEQTRQRLLDSMAAIPAASYRDALICFTHPLERFDFARLTMPVLLMTGAHDRLAPPQEIRGIAGRIWDTAPRPDVRFEVIPDAGHVCNLEQPEIYNRHLTDLLERLA
ncbi:alpha/beta fold hydrolase [Gemmobacter denitrificans]|uniref:Alpha/beta fold hydrolase n=1 Tax=Gemmobacter denitrificans TaxID=3123040 RepID=A0ABU8BZF5_9RHOB